MGYVHPSSRITSGQKNYIDQKEQDTKLYVNNISYAKNI